MGQCIITFDGKEYSYEEFAMKLHDGLLQELASKGDVDATKFKGDISPEILSVKPKVVVTATLSDLEVMYRENPVSLSKDQLKQVLEEKSERRRKAIANLEKGGLTPEEVKRKREAITKIESIIDDLILKIDSMSNLPVESKKSLNELSEKYNDSKAKLKVLDAVSKVIPTLKSIFPSMNIVIHENGDDFSAATGLERVEGKEIRGAFIYTKNEDGSYAGNIHIDLSIANDTTVYHEVAHAILLKTFGENQVAFKDFKRKVESILSENSNKQLNDFIANYSKTAQPEEYLVQLIAALTSTPSSIQKSVLAQIKSIINDIVSRLTGGAIIPFSETASNEEVFDFLKNISSVLTEGSVLNQKYLNEIASKFSDNITKSDLSSEINKQIAKLESVSIMKDKSKMAKFGLDANRNLTRKVAEALEIRQRKLFGLIDKNDRSESAIKKLSSWMASEVKFFIEAAGENSGKGWYGEKFQKALDQMGNVFPELKSDQNARDLFTMFVAVASDGEKVQSNLKIAAKTYDYYRKNGVMPTAVGAGRSAIVGHLAKIQKLLQEYNGDVAKIKETLLTIKSIKEINDIRKSSGLEPLKSDWPVDFKAPLAASIFSPKLGMFYANLSGVEDYPTLDRWWSRTFNRYRGTLIPTVKRGITPKGEYLGIDNIKNLLGNINMTDDEAIFYINANAKSYQDKGFKNGTELEVASNTVWKDINTNINDAPFNKTDREFMYNTIVAAKNKLNKSGYKLSIADIQAILWYYEKNLYKTLGVNAKIEGISYEEAAKLIAEAFKKNNNFDYTIVDDENNVSDEDGLDDADTVINQEENPVLTTEPDRAAKLNKRKEVVSKKIKAYVKNTIEESKKLGISGLKTRQQLIEQIDKDIEFFNDLVEYAIVSIELGAVKSLDQLRKVFKNDLNFDFGNNSPKQLKLVYEEAKKRASITKPDSIKTIIRNTTVSDAGKIKYTISFRQWISDRVKQENKLEREKAKAFKLGEQIGDANRQVIVDNIVEYLKDAGISNLAKSKILTIVKRSIRVKSIKSTNDLISYIDYVVANADYYAKVKQSEDLQKSVSKKFKKDYFGQITPLVSEFLNVDPSVLPEASLNDYIKLAEKLLESKVADASSITTELQSIKDAERSSLERSIDINIVSESEMIKMLDKIERLSQESQSSVLTAAARKAKQAELERAVTNLKRTLEDKKEDILAYIPQDGVADIKIEDAREYLGLISSIKTYNRAVNEMVSMGLISDSVAEEILIDINSEELGDLEKSLADVLNEFKVSFVDSIKALRDEIVVELKSGGLRADLFKNLSKKDQDIYSDVLDSLLDLDNSVYESLSVKQLDDIKKAFEQALNGYISPLLLRSLNELQVKSITNSLESKINQYVEADKKVDSAFKKMFAPFINKSVKDFTPPKLQKLMQGLDYFQIDAYIKESGLGRIYQEYMYYPLNRQYSKYNNVSNRLLDKAKKVADSMNELDRNIVGLLLIQADYMQSEEFNSLPDNEKDLAGFLMSQHSTVTPVSTNDDKVVMLDKARKALSKYDLTTKAGLEKATKEYLSSNKKAKDLYNIIRENMNGELYSMSKINTESEGGYFDYRDNYIPIQRRGPKDISVDDLDASLGLISKRTNIKLRSNATYKRVGDPKVFREFDAFRMYELHVDDVSKNFYIKPIYSNFLRSISEIANKNKKDNEDVFIFLNASQGALREAFKLRFGQLESKGLTVLRKINTFSRRTSIANFFRPIKEFPSNIAKILLSIRPNEYGDLFYASSLGQIFGSKQYIPSDVFDNLTSLVGSSVALNTNSTNIENQFGAYKARASRIDKVQGFSDEIAQRLAWKTKFISEFKKRSGKNFDKKEFSINPVEYLRNNKEALEKSVFEADLFLDKKFVTQSPIAKATTFKVVPFGQNYKRGGAGSTILETMNSYVINDYRVFWASFRKLINDPTTKNAGEFVGDSLPIVASNLMYVALAPLAQTAAASVGMASAEIAQVIFTKLTPDDDDDEDFGKAMQSVGSYSADVYQDAMDEIYGMILNEDGSVAYENFSKILATMLVGKYAIQAKLVYGLTAGLFVSGDVESEMTKSDKRSKFKARQDDLSVVNKYLDFKPIILTGSKFNVSKVTDVAGTMPFLGIPLNIMNTAMDSEDPTSVVSFVKEGKKAYETGDVDGQALFTSTTQLALLGMTAYGYYMAPTAYRAAIAPRKVEKTKEYLERQKQKESGSGSGGGLKRKLGKIKLTNLKRDL